MRGLTPPIPTTAHHHCFAALGTRHRSCRISGSSGPSGARTTPRTRPPKASSALPGPALSGPGVRPRPTLRPKANSCSRGMRSPFPSCATAVRPHQDRPLAHRRTRQVAPTNSFPFTLPYCSKVASPIPTPGPVCSWRSSGLFRQRRERDGDLLRPIATEVRRLDGWDWAEASDEQQGWYLAHEANYKKLRAKTGRDKWFDDTCAPATVPFGKRSPSCVSRTHSFAIPSSRPR